jgi:hypothetical protein
LRGAKRRGNPEAASRKELDCFVARAPRNDGVVGMAPSQHHRPISTHIRGAAWQTRREENAFIYVQLSFPAYESNCPCLDTEWLLSTLFDASLLSTSKPPETAALFWGCVIASPRWKP